MNRLDLLRREALDHPAVDSDEFYYKFCKKYFSSAEGTLQERYTDAFCYAFSQLTPSISDGELIVGKNACSFSPEEYEEWNTIYRQKEIELTDSAGGGQESHMAVDYELILTQGISGILDRIAALQKMCEPEKRSFYENCRRCLGAIMQYAESYAVLAMRLSEKEQDPLRKKELQTIAAVCRRVPANPAESFYEAVQSVHFITHCLSLDPFRYGNPQYQLGHPDRYLLPYFEKDIACGTITQDYAQLLLDCLGIQINMRVRHGLSSGYMVGGRDADGKIVANRLTEMCMQVIDDIRLVYPAVGFCYAEGMDDRYLRKACEILLHGRSHPAIFNDAVITKGLCSYGVPQREAHNYIHSTCVEITPVASSNVWVASPYTNMAQILLDHMDREYDNFEALLAAVFADLDGRIQRNFETQNAIRCVRSRNAYRPLLSCFVNDCLERGMDIEQGGARYNWIMPSFVGVANLVDSLYAIKETVFLKKEYSVCELKSILDADFKGNEPLRRHLLQDIPKYGNDIEDVDCLFGIITEHIITECGKYSGMHSNGNLIPSVFCWVMHDRFGQETGATPDGRHAGFPLGDGSGPCQGREMNGPTASILSSTKWDHHKLIGGVAVNMKFSKKNLGNDALLTMESLVKAYLERGGFEIQINVVSEDLLKKALECPEQYRDLVVRIGGYSDYFVKLSPSMQQEVILRTAHEL